MNFNLVNYLYFLKLLLLNQSNPTKVWLILLGMHNYLYIYIQYINQLSFIYSAGSSLSPSSEQSKWYKSAHNNFDTDCINKKRAQASTCLHIAFRCWRNTVAAACQKQVMAWSKTYTKIQHFDYLCGISSADSASKSNALWVLVLK